MINNPVGQVYFQEATKEKAETANASPRSKRQAEALCFAHYYYLGLYTLSSPSFLSGFLALIGEWLANMHKSPLLVAIQFISGPSNTNNIFEKQKLALAWQLGLLVLSLVTIFVAIQFELDFLIFYRRSLQSFSDIICFFT